MYFGTIALWVIGLLVALCCILAVGRFVTLRSRGATVLVRRLPARGFHGWRHGVVVYKGDYVEFFKLRSLSPMADLIISRLDIELAGTRRVTDDEATFISDDRTAQKIVVGDGEYEIAFTSHGLMAFGAWVEASPSRRMNRMQYRQLRDRAQRPMQTGSLADGQIWPVNPDRSRRS
ncbi:MAG: DUF2550 domain-containing protein [Corynebacterium sp.]|nr:DUF2550 domain-containing protein [Corynebacterium sp.]